MCSVELSADECISINTSISFGMWLSHFIEKNNTNMNISDRKLFPITAKCRHRGATQMKKHINYLTTLIVNCKHGMYHELLKWIIVMLMLYIMICVL